MKTAKTSKTSKTAARIAARREYQQALRNEARTGATGATDSYKLKVA